MAKRGRPKKVQVDPVVFTHDDLETLQFVVEMLVEEYPRTVFYIDDDHVKIQLQEYGGVKVPVTPTVLAKAQAHAEYAAE